MNLRSIQELFWRAISWPTGIDDFLAQADPSTREAFASTFAQTETFGRGERMQVYADAYFWRLYEVLVDQYEVTAWRMGPRRFHNFVTDYVLHRPSCSPDIRRFGDRLPAYLAAHAEAARVEGIEDVAAVEWAIFTALDAPAVPPLPASALAEIPVGQWPGLTLRLTPSTFLVPSRFDFSALWRAFRAGDPAEIDAGVAHVVVVWRRGLEVFHRRCGAAEGRALEALAQGRSFEAICDVASGPTTTEATAQDVVGWLTGWLRDGLIAEVRPG